MFKPLLAISSVALALSCGALNQAKAATTFDFATLASNAGVGEGFWNAKFPSGQHLFTVNGIGVAATATGNTNSFSGAYLDGPSGGLPAGLGVCSTSGGCAGTNDDNVGRLGDQSGGLPETLTLTFDHAVKLTDLFFRNADHLTFTGMLSINGTTVTPTGGELTAAALAFLPAGFVFNFTSLSNNANHTLDDFYLSSATVSQVPLPAALPLFATGLGALSLLGWRRKKKGAAGA
jgi:hypothetical protein